MKRKKMMNFIQNKEEEYKDIDFDFKKINYLNDVSVHESLKQSFHELNNHLRFIKIKMDNHTKKNQIQKLIELQNEVETLINENRIIENSLNENLIIEELEKEKKKFNSRKKKKIKCHIQKKCYFD